MHQPGRLAPGTFRSPVIVGGGGRVGMTGQIPSD